MGGGGALDVEEVVVMVRKRERERENLYFFFPFVKGRTGSGQDPVVRWDEGGSWWDGIACAAADDGGRKEHRRYRLAGARLIHVSYM
jgi:hypothetical protein